jgi:hypothetical protein
VDALSGDGNEWGEKGSLYLHGPLVEYRPRLLRGPSSDALVVKQRATRVSSSIRRLLCSCQQDERPGRSYSGPAYSAIAFSTCWNRIAGKGESPCWSQ